MFLTGLNCSKGGQRYPPHLSPGAPGGMGVGEGIRKDVPLLDKAQLVFEILIRWIVICPVDSAIQRLCNPGQLGPVSRKSR